MAGELTNNNVAVRSASATKDAAAESFAVANMQQSAAQIRQPAAEELQKTAEQTKKMPEKGYSRITYANVYGNTDVVYDLQANKVKESIVLGSYNSALWGYRYTLEVGTMIPELQEDGQIIFYDAAGKEIVMVMPAPYMIDDAGEYSNDIQVQLTGSGIRYTMTYLLPQQRLDAGGSNLYQ